MLDRRQFVRGAVALAMATLVAGCDRQAEDAPDDDAKNATAQAGPAEDPTPQEDGDPASIAQELRKPAGERRYQTDAIGIVTPLYEFDLPRPVEEFILGSTFETDYFYVVSTYGMHHGGIAERVGARLTAAGRRVDYYNTVIMLDNAIQVFDMDEQRKLDPGKHVEEHLASVRAGIEARSHYIQPAAQGEVDFYQGYMRHPFALRPSNEKPSTA